MTKTNAPCMLHVVKLRRHEFLADEELLKKYEAENEENKRLEQELQARLAEVSLKSGHRRYTGVSLSESCLSPLATLP